MSTAHPPHPPHPRQADTYSIGRRLSLLLAIQTVVGLGVLLACIYAVNVMLFKAKHEEQLQNYAKVMVDIARAGEERGGRAEALAKLAWSAERRPGTYMEVQDASGQTVYRDPPPPFDVSARSSKSLGFALPLANIEGWQARVWLDCSQDARTGQRMALLLVAVVIAGGALAGWGTFWRVRCSLRPLIDVADQTRAIDVARLDQRLSLAEPAEELQPVIEQFNGLMGRVERAYLQLEGFNADVAHELRTPLANLIGQTELALSRERPAAELADTLASNLEELNRLAGMVNDMLFLAQADRGVKARRGEPVALSALVHQVLEFHEAPLSEADLSVEVAGEQRAAVDAPLVKRALSNLLGNAIRHATPGTRITVRLDPDDAGGVRLWVENQGDPVPQHHLPRLFDRFFRVDSSRCELDRPHHGLGLSIVAAIARMHEGSPMAESTPERTRIGFSLAHPTPAGAA
ncbi:MAG: two-component sensor histidine kinase [Comamonadaceae bacterium]|nr:two-component sensor histidine kinase [Comamonadaceae bacterium]